MARTSVSCAERNAAASGRMTASAGMAIVLATGRNDPGPSRQRERLVAEGCRTWLNGNATGSIDCWGLGWSVFARERGAHYVLRLLGELACWVGERRRAKKRQLLSFPDDRQCLRRDERLALSLVAARQNGDAATSRSVAPALAGADERAAVETADTLASALDALHRLLLRVPLAVVEDIAGRAPTTRLN